MSLVYSVEKPQLAARLYGICTAIK